MDEGLANADSYLRGNLGGDRHYFAQITDTHIGGGADGGESDLFRDRSPRRKLVSALGWLSKLNPAPDFILITGDLSDHGRPAELATFVSTVLEGTSLPVRPVRGNHDGDLGAVLDALQGRPEVERARMEGTGYCYALDYQGLRLIVLDSEAYSLGSDEQRWLSTELAGVGDRSFLVASHRHIYPVGNLFVDNQGPGFAQRDGSAMAAQLTGTPGFSGLLCGHVHITKLTTEGEFRQFALTSTFYAFENLGAVEGGLYTRFCHVDAGRLQWTAIANMTGPTTREWPVER
jgi:3',5'-cyclic AMP phosphodiesterase CpdA